MPPRLNCAKARRGYEALIGVALLGTADRRDRGIGNGVLRCGENGRTGQTAGRPDEVGV